MVPVSVAKQRRLDLIDEDVDTGHLSSTTPGMPTSLSRRTRDAVPLQNPSLHADVMCIVSRVPATVVDDARPTKRTHHELQLNQQTSHGHAIAENDEERRTVLLVHTDQDAEHLEHVEDRKEHSVKYRHPQNQQSTASNRQHNCPSVPYRPRCQASGPDGKKKEYSAS